jgi:4'-phosphopantetheinyl transferase
MDHQGTRPRWVVPDRTPDLGTGEIHIWRILCRGSSAQYRSVQTRLSESERSKADAFIFDKDRRLYMAAHIGLRTLLASYLKMDPCVLRFGTAHRGKPISVDAPEVRFNLSHSGQVVLLAFSVQHELGVDVELLRPLDQLVEFARKNFHPGEYDRIVSTPPPMRQRLLFTCWTRKEAYVKLLGTGLYTPLDSFEVTVDRPAALVRVGKDVEGARRWSLLDLEPAPSHVGCLAVDCRRPQIAFFEYDLAR